MFDKMPDFPSSFSIPIGREKNFKVTGYGLYVFYDKDRNPIYAGWSGDLDNRLQRHFVASGLMKYMPDAVMLSITFKVPQSEETEFIRIYKPKLNGVGLTGKANRKTTDEDRAIYKLLTEK